MKKTKINFIIMLAFLLASFTSNYAIAQGQCQQHGKEGTQGEGMCKGDKDMAFITDLTADQQKQISALKLNFIKERITIQNLIEEKQAHLKTISTGDNVDMVAVNKTIDELFALKADLQKKHMTFQQDVRKLLTADQKVIFDLHAGKCKGEGMEQGCQMHGKEKSDCKSGGNSSCQGKGNCDMKHCNKTESGNGCCKGQTGQGQGCGKMQGCQHGQGRGNGNGCNKKN
jgi:Spy/CpxP family protein refolding chaperone